MLIYISNSNASPYLKGDYEMPIYKIKNTKKEGLQKYMVRINYVADNGTYETITRTAYGIDVAKDIERRLEYEIKQQREMPIKKITVKQIFDEYISIKKYEVRETSLDKTKRILEYHVLPTLAGIRIDKLSTKVLQEWKIAIEEKGLALTTKQNIFTEIRTMLNYAVRMEYIPKHQLSKVRKL